MVIRELGCFEILYSNLKVIIRIGQIGRHVDRPSVHQYVHVNVYRSRVLIT